MFQGLIMICPLYVLDDLIRKSELLPQFIDKYYMLFSKSGFTAVLRERAKKENNIRLVYLEDMFL